MNAVARLNDINCSSILEVNDIPKPGILQIDDILLCTRYYELSSCCITGLTDPYYVYWEPTYTPSSLNFGDVFTDPFGNCWKVSGFLSGATGTQVYPSEITPTIYSSCTQCTNTNGCFYLLTECCTSGPLEVNMSSSFTGSGATTIAVYVTIKGVTYDLCATIGDLMLSNGGQFPATGGTSYAGCNECTNNGELCRFEVNDCCTEIDTAVISGFTSGNTVVSDSNGKCWSLMGAGLPDSGLTVTQTVSTFYNSCYDCLSYNDLCLWTAEPCCYDNGNCTGSTDTVQLPYFTSPGNVWSDGSGKCWKMVESLTAGTASVTLQSSHSDCCTCLQTNNSYANCVGNFLCQCCYDTNIIETIAGEVDLAIGNVVVINGYCYEIIDCWDKQITAYRDCTVVFPDCDQCGSGGYSTSACS